MSSCGSSSQQQSEQSTQMLQSWTRTVDLAAQQRAKHCVPDVYVKQVLRTAKQALGRERRKIHRANNPTRQQLELLAHELEIKIREQQLNLRRQTQSQQ
jgi:hypothetical protein